MKNETLTKTDNDMIFVEKDTPLSRDAVEKKLDILRNAVKDSENEIASPKIKNALYRVVPTFCDPNKVNKTAEDAEEMKEVNENTEDVTAV